MPSKTERGRFHKTWDTSMSSLGVQQKRVLKDPGMFTFVEYLPKWEKSLKKNWK